MNVSAAPHKVPAHPWGGPDALSYAAPFAALVLALAAQSALWEPAGLDPRWAYPLRAALVAGVLVWALRRAALRPVPWPSLRQWALAGVTGTAVFGLWLALDVPWARVGEVATFNPYDGLDPAAGHALAVARVAGAVLVIPLAEELFFRGWLMRVLVSPRFRDVPARAVPWWAVAVQAGVFALAHAEVLAAALAGLAYGALYRATGRLGVAIGAHALTNALLAAWVLRHGAWHLW